MKASFIAAGFTENLCAFTLYDNSLTNRFDPYQTVNAIQNEYGESYIIFCHQDIVIDRGDNLTSLVQRLDELQQVDPRWVICGNAGVNFNYEYVVRITDPSNSPNWKGIFPQRVMSLDENFLIIKSTAGIHCSATLKGFHFYGSDLCLQAIRKGASCYVIDFHLYHLSGGTFSDSYWEVKSAFYNNWSNQFRFCYIKTITGQFMCFSKSKFLRAVGAFKIVRKVLLLINRIHPFLYPN